jgi:hypothetical protein
VEVPANAKTQQISVYLPAEPTAPATRELTQNHLRVAEIPPSTAAISTHSQKKSINIENKIYLRRYSNCQALLGITLTTLYL